ncbi:DinB family protein [Oceanobacillus saliphilus]|uniref:DinB family protein n=1 Tax=Oceanobacillus saliphilus TaxID=2925834 RepID=UPI00201DDD18|nr:DinB family protein [Oceanobacillus saliphilus]
MAESKVDSYVESINTSIDKMLTSVEDVSEDVIRWNPHEDEWSILQILSHVREATLYWLSELETVLDKPGSEWGRGLQNPERLRAVENTEALDVEEVIAEVANLKLQVSERLAKVDDDRLAEENPHRNFAKFGNKPVTFLIEHFIVDHVEGHYSQIQRNLSKLRTKTTK